MSLKNKIFSFGIFGRKASELTEDELEQIKNEQWAEIMSPEQVEHFRHNFSLALVPKPAFTGSIPKEYSVRMNLIAWFHYIFRNEFKIKSSGYFFILDYLITHKEYVSASFLREKFSIDPKTMHYLCKQLLQKKVIEEMKERNENYVRFVGICETEADKENKRSECHKINLKNIKFYNNVPLYEQIAAQIQKSANGLDSKDIFNTFGIKPKTALKFLCGVCQKFPDDFKIVSSIENKHTVYKCFYIANLEKRNLKKMKAITGEEDPPECDTLLTPKDRQEVLKVLAEKSGHFHLSKDKIDEIARVTGYPYKIDRKNLLSNAKEAGLKVIKINTDKQPIPKYIIAQPHFDENTIKDYCAKPKTNLSEFYKKMIRYFVNMDKRIIQDNGYSFNTNMPADSLFSELSRHAPDETTGFVHFNYDIVTKMSVKKFYDIIKVRTLNLRARCSFELYKAYLGFWPEDAQRFDNMYLDEDEPRRIDNRVFKLQEKVDTLCLGEYIEMLPPAYQNSLREFAKPMKFLNVLKALAAKNMIDLEITADNRILYCVRNGTGPEESANLEDKNAHNLLFVKKTLTYNIVCQFLHLVKDSSQENFLEKAETAILNNFGSPLQDLLYKACCGFLKVSPEKRFKPKSYDVSSSLDRKVYLMIKKAVIFRNILDFSSIEESDHVSIERILEHMNDNDIITGYRQSYSFLNISISQKLKDFLGDHLPSPGQSNVSDEEYYEIFASIVYKLVKTHGSVDFDTLLSKIRFLEAFELEALLEMKKDVFNKKTFEEFVFISLVNVEDPFS